MGMNDLYYKIPLGLVIVIILIAIIAIIVMVTQPIHYKYEDMDGNIGIAESCHNSKIYWTGKVAVTESSVLNCNVGNKTIMVKWYEPILEKSDENE